MEAHFALLRADSREAVRGGNHDRRLEDPTSRGLDADPTAGFEALQGQLEPLLGNQSREAATYLR